MNDNKELKGHRVPTPAEAHQIMQRFNASHFNLHNTEHARYRIPADPSRDDDILMSSFIRDYERMEAEVGHWKQHAKDAAAERKDMDAQLTALRAAPSTPSTPPAPASLARGETLKEAVHDMTARESPATVQPPTPLQDAWAQIASLSATVDSLQDRCSQLRSILGSAVERRDEEITELKRQLKRQLDYLRPHAVKNDQMAEELDQIGKLIGCDHVEGLANCVRSELTKLRADLQTMEHNNKALADKLAALPIPKPRSFSPGMKWNPDPLGDAY